jgi:hypothetical protein
MLTPQEEEAARLRNLEQQRATGSLDMAYFGPYVDNSALRQQRQQQKSALEQMAATGPQNVDLTAPANNPFTTVPSSPYSFQVLAPGQVTSQPPPVADTTSPTSPFNPEVSPALLAQVEGMAATVPQNVDLTAPVNNPFSPTITSQPFDQFSSTPGPGQITSQPFEQFSSTPAPPTQSPLTPEVNPAVLAQVEAYFQNQGAENVQSLQRMRAAQLQAMLPFRTPTETYGYGQPFNPQAMNLTSPQNNPYSGSQPFNNFMQQRNMANQASMSPFNVPRPIPQEVLNDPGAFRVPQNPFNQNQPQPRTLPTSQPRQNFFNPPQQRSFFNRNLPQQPKGTFSPSSEVSPFTQDQSGQNNQNQDNQNQSTTQNQTTRSLSAGLF